MADTKSSPNVDPAIFQFLQDKIDEEGKIRDVPKSPKSFCTSSSDIILGAQRDHSDPRKARLAHLQSTTHATSDSPKAE